MKNSASVPKLNYQTVIRQGESDYKYSPNQGGMVYYDPMKYHEHSYKTQ